MKHYQVLCSRHSEAEACEWRCPGVRMVIPWTQADRRTRAWSVLDAASIFCGRSFPLRRGPSDPLLRRSSRRLHPAQDAGLRATSRTLPWCPWEQGPPFPQLCRVLSCFLLRPLHKQPRSCACRERQTVMLTTISGPSARGAGFWKARAQPRCCFPATPGALRQAACFASQRSSALACRQSRRGTVRSHARYCLTEPH